MFASLLLGKKKALQSLYLKMLSGLLRIDSQVTVTLISGQVIWCIIPHWSFIITTGISLSSLHCAPALFPLYSSLGYQNTITSWSLVPCSLLLGFIPDLENMDSSDICQIGHFQAKVVPFSENIKDITPIYEHWNQDGDGSIIRSDKYWSSWVVDEWSDEVIVIQEGKSLKHAHMDKSRIILSFGMMYLYNRGWSSSSTFFLVLRNIYRLVYYVFFLFSCYGYTSLQQVQASTDGGNAIGRIWWRGRVDRWWEPVACTGYGTLRLHKVKVG